MAPSSDPAGQTAAIKMDGDVRHAPRSPANGIELCYETFGDPDDPPLLLDHGPRRPDDRLGRRVLSGARPVAGFHVIRFDNRDVGQSTWIDTPDLDLMAPA